MVLRHRRSVLVVLVQVVVLCHSAGDRGFNLLFTTNNETFIDVPITFAKPLPDWVRGTWIKNGLGQFEMGGRKFGHAFDAFSKLTKWEFRGGREMLFTHKFLYTESFKAAVNKKNIQPYLLLADTIPVFSILEKLESLWNGIDNTNVNVFQYGDTNGSHFSAVSDFWKTYTFDRDLNTVGMCSPPVPQGDFFTVRTQLSTAHPVKEHGTTNYITFVSSISPIPVMPHTISLIRIKSLNTRELIAKWDVAKVPYMHSFALSRSYAIIFEHPLYVSITKMLASADVLNSLEWHPDLPTIVRVINIKTGEIINLVTEAMTYLHHINSYETSGDVIITDFVTYPDMEYFINMRISTFLNRDKRNSLNPNSEIHRIILNLNKRSVTIKKFPVKPKNSFVNRLDLPIINERYRFRRYKHVYGYVVKFNGKNASSEALVKKHLNNPRYDRYWRKRNHYPSEPWFVPHPHQHNEADGLLLCPILDGNRGRTYIGVFHPKSLRLLNYAYLPTALPMTIHGRFFEND